MPLKRVLVVSAAITLTAAMAAGPSAGAGPSKQNFVKKVSGTVSIDLTRSPAIGSRAAPKGVRAPALTPNKRTLGCSDHSATNVRANQECTNQSAPDLLGRAQSQNETAVAVNPRNPHNVIITQNDYRGGDGNCGVNFSLDGGRHWGSGLAPMNFGRGFEGGARHYWTSGGDTSVGFDSSGEAYLMCQVFVRGFPTHEEGDHAPFGSSAFMIFRSADGGASWSFPGNYVATTAGAARGDPVGLLDKEYMAVDSGRGSPFRDRIYVAWANYPADFSTAPIYFAYSTDHGVTWHQSGMINGADPALCPVTFGTDPPGTCNNSQFADPFVAPNGDVYVTFINGNNCNGGYPGCPNPPSDNHFQILIVKSTDGGNTFGPPVKVGDYYELPDCVTYTGDDAFRACVPTAPLSNRSIFRAANYPSAVAVRNDRIVVDYASYINRHSNPDRGAGRGHCVPAGFNGATGLPLYTGVGDVNGCNNDIVRSISTNGGASFTGTPTPVTSLPSVNDEGRVLADQWFQWTARTPTGGVVTSYYDRKYGHDQSTGFMDFTLKVSGGAYVRVTDQSLPPSNEFPGTSGYSLFMGDYTGLAVGSDGVAHPAWEDTRNPIYTFDEGADARNLIFAGYGGDTYTASVHLHRR
jgi:hypothetical protein